MWTRRSRAFSPPGWGRVKLYANRVAFALANGAIPDGQRVLPTCKNARCVNPNHLILSSTSYDAAKWFGVRPAPPPPPPDVVDSILRRYAHVATSVARTFDRMGKLPPCVTQGDAECAGLEAIWRAALALHANFLFERPAAFWIAPNKARAGLQAAE